MNDYVPWVNLILSGGSFIVAIIALSKSSKVQSKNIELQQSLVQIEQRRDQLSLFKANSAMLRAELREYQSNSYRLCISNDGNVSARNVRIELGGMSFLKHPAFISGTEIPELIGPKSEITCLIAIHMNCAPPFALRVLWDDDCGANHKFETTLTFP